MERLETATDRSRPRPTVSGLAVAALALVVANLLSASWPGHAAWQPLVLAGWVLLILIWVYRLLGMRARRPASRGWVVGPALWLTMLVLVQADIPLRLRFELSRPAFDALVVDVTQSSRSTTLRDRPLGLFHATEIWRDGDDIAVVVEGAGWGMFTDWGGFFRTAAPEGPPADPDASYVRLGDEWFGWVQGW